MRWLEDLLDVEFAAPDFSKGHGLMDVWLHDRPTPAQQQHQPTARFSGAHHTGVPPQQQQAPYASPEQHQRGSYGYEGGYAGSYSPQWHGQAQPVPMGGHRGDYGQQYPGYSEPVQATPLRQQATYGAPRQVDPSEYNRRPYDQYQDRSAHQQWGAPVGQYQDGRATAWDTQQQDLRPRQMDPSQRLDPWQQQVTQHARPAPTVPEATARWQQQGYSGGGHQSPHARLTDRQHPTLVDLRPREVPQSEIKPAPTVPQAAPWWQFGSSYQQAEPRRMDTSQQLASHQHQVVYARPPTVPQVAPSSYGSSYGASSRASSPPPSPVSLGTSITASWGDAQSVLLQPPKRTPAQESPTFDVWASKQPQPNVSASYEQLRTQQLVPTLTYSGSFEFKPMGKENLRQNAQALKEIYQDLALGQGDNALAKYVAPLRDTEQLHRLQQHKDKVLPIFMNKDTLQDVCNTGCVIQNGYSIPVPEDVLKSVKLVVDSARAMGITETSSDMMPAYAAVLANGQLPKLIAQSCDEVVRSEVPSDQYTMLTTALGWCRKTAQTVLETGEIPSRLHTLLEKHTADKEQTVATAQPYIPADSRDLRADYDRYKGQTWTMRSQEAGGIAPGGRW